MNILVSDDKQIINNMIKTINREYKEEDLFVIDDKNIIVYVDNYFYDIYINGIGFKLFEFYIDMKKVLVSVNVNNYESIDTLEEVMKVTGNNEVNLINCCSSNGRGQLNFEILKKVIKKKDNLSYKRVWFNSQDENELIKALRNIEDNEKYKSLADSFLAEKIIDLYWEENSNKITGLENKLNIKMLFLLQLLWQKEQKIKEHEKNNYFKLYIYYEGIKGTWLDKRGTDKVYKIEEAKNIRDTIKDKSIFILTSDIKIASKEHPLLYNQSDILYEAQKLKGMDANKCRDILNKLYIRGYITNPNTNSRHLRDETKNILMSILSNLKKMLQYEPYIMYIKEIVKAKKLSTRIINEQFVDENEAIIPTTKSPVKDFDLSRQELLIYDYIARRFLAIFMDDQVSRKINISGIIGDGHRIKTEKEEILRYGYTILNYKPEDVLKIIKTYKETSDPKDQRKLVIHNGDVCKIEQIQIKEQKGRGPNRYTEASLLKSMDNCGEYIRNELTKVEKRNLGIGSPGERYFIIEQMIDKEYIRVEDDKIHIEELGLKVLDNVPEKLLDLQLLQLFNKRVSSIKEKSSSLEEVVEGHCKIINKIINEAPPIEDRRININYEEILKKIRCPICGSSLKDRGNFIGCIDYKACRFSISKVIKGYVLREKDYIDIYEKGMTDFIEKFRFKNNNQEKAYLKVNKVKRKLEFKF